MDLHQLNSGCHPNWYIYYEGFNYSLLHEHGFTITSSSLSDLVPYDIQLPSTVTILRISDIYGSFMAKDRLPWVYAGDTEGFYDFIDRMLA